MQHRHVVRADDKADLRITVGSKKIRAPAHGEVCHDLIDHTVAGKQILHLASGLVGAVRQQENVPALRAEARKRLHGVAAEIAAEQNAVADIRPVAIIADLDQPEAGLRQKLCIRSDVAAHRVEQDVIALLRGIIKHLLHRGGAVGAQRREAGRLYADRRDDIRKRIQDPTGERQAGLRRRAQGITEFRAGILAQVGRDLVVIRADTDHSRIFHLTDLALQSVNGHSRLPP